MAQRIKGDERGKESDKGAKEAVKFKEEEEENGRGQI